MDDFSNQLEREHLQEEYKKAQKEAKRAVESFEEEKAVRNLRKAAKAREELAGMTDMQDTRETYRARAEELREKADRIETHGIPREPQVHHDGGSQDRRARSSNGTKLEAPQKGGRRGTAGEGPDAEGPLVEPEVPSVSFSDVGGMTDLKQLLMDKIADPILRRDLHEKYGLNPIPGVLLQGPPGTGKTHITKAFAGEVGWNIMTLTPSDVVSALVGESAKNIHQIFEQARDHTPIILFFDEIDSIATSRESNVQTSQSSQMMLAQFLQEMNESYTNEGIIVFGATNAPENVDKALRNSKRFAEVIEVPLPDSEARKAIVSLHLRDRPVPTEEIDLDSVAESTAGFSGADMENVAMDSARNALQEAKQREEIVPIQHHHVLSAVQQRKRSRDDSEKGGYLQ